MKLISGGQSGVDRAALDVAATLGIPYGGWCPKGGWAEDFPAPPGLLAKYSTLRETPLADPAQRTEWNVRDADACLIIVESGRLTISKGTMLARKLAQDFGKPVLVTNLSEQNALDHARSWLEAQQRLLGRDLGLAIGGPRESEVPGIYARASAFLRELMT
jgi:hypothetical protein